MRGEAGDADLGALLQQIEQPAQVLGLDADAAHAGVELDMGVGGDATRPRGRGERFDHVRPVDERRDPVLQEEAVIRVLPAKGEDRCGDPDVAQREAFLDERDPEPLRSRGEERAGGDGGAMTVSVRLHHRADAGAGRGAAGFLEVVLQSVCVDARFGRTDAQIERAPGRLVDGREGHFSGRSCCQGRASVGITLTTPRAGVGFPGAPG